MVFSCSLLITAKSNQYSSCWLGFDVMFSRQHAPFLLGKGDTFPHDLGFFLWTCSQSPTGTQTDPLQPISGILIPDQKVKCILQICFTNFLNYQPSKFNNALNFHMWLHLTFVSLPINGSQLRFFRGKGMLERRSLNQRNSIVQEIFYCTKESLLRLSFGTVNLIWMHTCVVRIWYL